MHAYMRISCRAAACERGREGRASFPGRVLQHSEPPELRKSQQRPDQPAVRPLDANAGEQSRVRRLKRRLQPSLKLCASDFTHMTELGITLGGQTFEHLV